MAAGRGDASGKDKPAARVIERRLTGGGGAKAMRLDSIGIHFDRDMGMAQAYRCLVRHSKLIGASRFMLGAELSVAKVHSDSSAIARNRAYSREDSPPVACGKTPTFGFSESGSCACRSFEHKESVFGRASDRALLPPKLHKSFSINLSQELRAACDFEESVKCFHVDMNRMSAKPKRDGDLFFTLSIQKVTEHVAVAAVQFLSIGLAQ